MSQNFHLINQSKQLRSTQTPWEHKLWYFLRAKRFFGIKFKRQVIIEHFIVDFCSFDKKLIIELDGSQHYTKNSEQKDQKRDKITESLGYTTLRFSNLDIDKNIESVLEKIRITLKL